MHREIECTFDVLGKTQTPKEEGSTEVDMIEETIAIDEKCS